MLNIRITGAGEKQIIFIHGNSQSLEDWNPVIENLSSNTPYSFVTLDLPGNGKSAHSPNPPVDYSFINIGRSIKEVIDKLNHPNYIIVALSLGTNFVGEVISELKHCKGVMLVGPCIVGKEAPLETIFLPNPKLSAIFMAEPSNEEIDALIEEALYRSSEKLKKEIRDTFKSADPNFRTAVANSVNNQHFGDEVLNYKTSGLPLALVFGGEEKICNIKYLDKVNFNKWRNETILISECGHLCNLDQPNELAKLIEAFAKDCF